MMAQLLLSKSDYFSVLISVKEIPKRNLLYRNAKRRTKYQQNGDSPTLPCNRVSQQSGFAFHAYKAMASFQPNFACNAPYRLAVKAKANRRGALKISFPPSNFTNQL